MTGTWTDDDLDAALHDLAITLDPDPAGAHASLAAVRARLYAAASSGPAPAEVLELGSGDRAATPRPRRWAPALLVAAALVAAVTLVAVLWPGGADRAAPARPAPTRSAPSVAAQLALLPEPLPPVGRSYTVITTTSGVGDAVVRFTPVRSATDPDGNPVVLSYNFVCGRPDVVAADRAGPSQTASPVLDFSIADNREPVGASACSGLADGRRAADSYSYGQQPTGRDEVRIDVEDPDTVWKLTVTAASDA